jgi:hypothetical protein
MNMLGAPKYTVNKGRGFKVWEFRGLGICIRKEFKSNRIQTSEFEFQQPKEMLQLVCNK